jgi:catechol 2,3-dioxygenase-like lactoylglutathione lyase family enzyme
MTDVFAYICLGTNDMERSCRFYDAVMATLGHARCDTSAEAGWEDWAGWGIYADEGRRQDALWVCRPFDRDAATSGNGTMVALRAKSWREVDAFHAAAIANGGQSDGPPGLRAYNADFYATYVRDPNGNKLAVVCRGFTQREGQR